METETSETLRPRFIRSSEYKVYWELRNNIFSVYVWGYAKWKNTSWEGKIFCIFHNVYILHSVCEYTILEVWYLLLLEFYSWKDTIRKDSRLYWYIKELISKIQGSWPFHIPWQITNWCDISVWFVPQKGRR